VRLDEVTAEFVKQYSYDFFQNNNWFCKPLSTRSKGAVLYEGETERNEKKESI
jgi:hypothetical protein